MRSRSLAVPLTALLGLGCRETPRAPPQAVTVAVPYEIDSLDPHAADRLSAFAILFNAYEGLVDVDAELRLRPGLAQSWECPDPLTWIFHLRPRVTFHSARPLRAKDVVYSLNRVRRTDALQVGNFVRDLVDVEALDELTVRLRTASPSQVLLAKLRHVAVVPEGTTAERLHLSSDGTGPFAVAAWRVGEDVVLRRHESYWSTKPSLREVRMALGRSPEQAVDGLRAGGISSRSATRAQPLAPAGSSRRLATACSSSTSPSISPTTSRPATGTGPTRSGTSASDGPSRRRSTAPGSSRTSETTPASPRSRYRAPCSASTPISPSRAPIPRARGSCCERLAFPKASP